MLLARTKLNNIKVMISKSLSDSNHDEFVPVNNMLRKYNENERRNQKSWKCCGIGNVKAMGTYCVGCKKSTANKNYSIRRTKENRLMLVSNCAVCDKKRLRLIKNQEASVLKHH